MRVGLILVVASLGLMACNAPNRPVGTPANPSAAPGSQSSAKPSTSPLPGASSAPQPTPTPRELGFRDFEGPGQGKVGEAVVLSGKMLVGNACAGPSKMAVAVDEAKREVVVTAQQQINPTPGPGEEGPICPAVVSEIPASGSFTPKATGTYRVRVGVGFDVKAQGFNVQVIAADATASSPVPVLTPGPLPSADAGASGS